MKEFRFAFRRGSASAFRIFTAAACARRLILSWLIAVAVQYLSLPRPLRSLTELDGLAAQSFFLLCFMTLTAFILLSLLAKKFLTERIERWGIFFVFALLSLVALCSSFTVPYFVGCLLILAMLGVYAGFGWNGRKENGEEPIRPLQNFRPYIILTGFALLFFVFVSVWTVCRVLSYSCPTFDFGIFSQMFHQMKTSGLPTTTVERDGLLSHFSVHVSPIFYLLLPFYSLYPKPVTLQVLQAAVLVSAVIPLWKLCRRHGLSPAVSVLLSLLLLLYPAYSGGASYDIHENAFLTPLLLWLFYGIDCEKRWVVFLSGALTLMVKEDAAVYVAVVSLWLLLRSLLYGGKRNRWGLITGSILLLSSLVWFFLVTAYLENRGDGVMTYRYRNFMFSDSGSLLSVVAAVLLSPMKMIYECVDAEKLSFLAYTILPLAGMPFLTRRYERFVLLIPYVLVNLMSDYQYQHDIFFQYTYGSTACLFYLTLVNLKDFLDVWERKKAAVRFAPVCAALLVSCACFAVTVVPKAIWYPEKYLSDRRYYLQVEQFLEQIPDDASVAATTFYTVPLSQRAVLYDVKYASQEHLLSTQYVVLGVGNEGSYTPYATDGQNGYRNLVRLLEQNGYSLVDRLENRIEIYKR